VSVEVTTGLVTPPGKGPRERGRLVGDALDLLVATARCWRPWHGYEKPRCGGSIRGGAVGLVARTPRTPRELVET